jgi:hypothetical protein
VLIATIRSRVARFVPCTATAEAPSTRSSTRALSVSRRFAEVARMNATRSVGGQLAEEAMNLRDRKYPVLGLVLGREADREDRLHLPAPETCAEREPKCLSEDDELLGDRVLGTSSERRVEMYRSRW